jgi:LytS/YehU family sensor histidine kinase
MFLAMSVKLTKKWIESRRKAQQLEKENLENELKFLRSQLNPHFLFNTINSIFVLIHKNPDLASDALAKFSDLLRYQLYECSGDQIPLSEEVAYLKSYLQLETLRQDQTKIKIEVDLADTTRQDLAIAPLLLIPFVENAFKHVGEAANTGKWIRIEMQAEGDTVSFRVSNSISLVKASQELVHSGVGLKNVKRRLDLIYPDKYELKVEEDDQKYQIDLTLQLTMVRMTADVELANQYA